MLVMKKILYIIGIWIIDYWITKSALCQNMIKKNISSTGWLLQRSYHGPSYKDHQTT